MYTLIDSSRAFAETADQLIDARLRRGDTTTFAVTTRSMSPTLQPGDRLTARGARAEEARLGDILLVKTQGAWLVHRLIERRVENGALLWVTKGDNCVEPDPAWRAAQVSGVVESVERGGRRLNLTSRRARLFNVWITTVSRAQWLAWRTRPGFIRRITLFCSNALLRVGTLAARWTAG